ncbi:sensor histidine kinase [Actinoplanes bogorensis]|uniref:histidine kinase n=1 Tax=Paractinoplanes bogorensis TaxID=1610840 RepID=A0ABS5YX42_9ACTN|nr:sensor histidine kinase [Actinoplanes bogorensis]MBU2668006.1 sensor histidine kinase [Actinoplanes bogorensis]
MKRWVAIDAAAVTAVAVLATLAWPGQSVGRGPGWPAGVLLLAALVLAAVRRLLPAPLLAVGAVGAALSGPAPAAVVAAAFLVYLVPTRLPRAPAVAVLAASGVAALLAADGYLGLASRPPRGGAASVALPALIVVLAWAAGYAAEQQRSRAELALREQVTAERQAWAEERLTIAREVHDVVAHTLAVITVEAGVAHHVARSHPEEAQRALGSIEETGRVALGEMRGLLDLLRAAAPGQEATEPAPGLAAVLALVDRNAAAGLAVELTVVGPPAKLTPGPDQVAYRIVQESLTNVLKHARTARCDVRLTWAPTALTIEVTDDGRGGGPPTAAAGHGLLGMRERLAVYGGHLTAGPRPSGGFTVTAVLPTTPATT